MRPHLRRPSSMKERTVKAPAPLELKDVTLDESSTTTCPRSPKGDEPVVTSFLDEFALGYKDTGLQSIL
jgi:hypothetical protein